MEHDNSEHINSIFRDFVQAYFEKNADITDQEWLKALLKEKELEIPEEELNQYSSDLVGSVKSFSETLRSLEQSRNEGKTVAEWLQAKVQESGKEIAVEQLHQLNECMEQAAARALRNIKAEDEHQAVNPSLMNVSAEQHLIDSFNENAVADGGQFEAEIDYPAVDARYGHDLFDVVIKDKFTGRRLENYQIIRGKDLQETIDLVAETTPAGQTIIVPEEMLEEIQEEFPFREFAARLGGTELVSSVSKALGIKDTVDLLTKSPILEKIVTDPAETISEIADKTFSAGVFANGLQQGLDRLLSNQEVEEFSASGLLEKALLSENTDGIKTAAAGALALAVHKGLVSVLPKDASPVVVADLASVGVENLKMFSKIADGAMSFDESIEHMGNMNVAMGFEYVWNTYATPFATKFLSAIPVVGPLISTGVVGKQILNFVKTPFKELVVEGAKQIIPTVKKVAKKAMKAGKKILKAGKKLLKSLFSW